MLPSTPDPTAPTKKARRAKRGGGPAPQDPDRMQRTSMMVGAAVGVLLAGIVAFMGWKTLVVADREQQLHSFAQQYSQRAASNVSNYLDALTKQVAFVTGSRPLQEALQQSDVPIGENVRQMVARAVPQAADIRIFRLNEAQLDLESGNALRFSEIDLIRRVERGEAVLPEAFETQGKSYFNLVLPVLAEQSGQVLGTILLTVPLEHLTSALQEGVVEHGRVVLQQFFEGRPRNVGEFGSGNAYTAPVAEIAKTPWKVEFTASDTLHAQTQTDMPLLIIFWLVISAVIMAICLSVSYMVGRRMKRKSEVQWAQQVQMGQAPARGDEAGSTAPVDILDIQILEEDRELLGLEEVAAPAPAEAPPPPDRSAERKARANSEVPDHIFRSYDIRGLALTEISKGLAQKIGQALGSEAQEQGETALIVARDARTHSPLLTEKLIRGILSTGCNVINIGTVPTPLLYFATEILEESHSGVMVTASHNKAPYNGFKIVMNRKSRTEKDIKAVRARILKNDFRSGVGEERHQDVVARYIETIFSDIALAGDVRLVIDAANGVAGKVAPQLFSELGCQVIPLYCDLDGTFPHHDPDPSVAENLQDLINKVQETGAQLGVAFDGDGDRLAVVTPSGQIIWPDRLLMLLAKDILARNPGGDVVFDVKSSRLLNTVVSNSGGRPIMWKTGHSQMRAKVLETGALIGGEYSGHIFIKDRWFGFDDGLYAAARLIEIMSLRNETADEIFAEFPTLLTTPEIRVAVTEEKKFQVIEQLVQHGQFDDARLITLDGLRAEFPFGWGLVRASNTSAELTLRFEAETEEHIHQLKALFTREIRKIDESIRFNW